MVHKGTLMQDLIIAASYIVQENMLLWAPWLIGLHGGADLLTALAYLSFPLAMLLTRRKRKGAKVSGLVWAGLGLITLGGVSHLLSAMMLWVPAYEVQGWVKMAIAVVSVGLAVRVCPQIPRALSLPSASDLQKVNRDLEKAVEAQRETHEHLRLARKNLEEKVESQAAALRENEHRFQRYQEMSPAGFMMLRSIREKSGEIADFEWTYANASACRMLRKERVLGARMLSAAPSFANNGIFDLFRRVVEMNEAITKDVHYSGYDVDAWFTMSVAKVDDGFAVAFDDITEKQERENQIRLLMREVNHRSKNLLAIVQSIAYQTAQRGDPASFIDDLTHRLQGLSVSQDLMIEGRWQGVEIADLIRSQLSHLGRALDERVSFDGPRVVVTPSAAQALGMALHELSTNAIKYGALKNDGGHIHIGWTVKPVDGHRQFELTWREEGGPRVEQPTRTGFGRMVFEQMTGHALQGDVSIAYDPEGLKWTLKAPFRNVVATSPATLQEAS